VRGARTHALNSAPVLQKIPASKEAGYSNRSSFAQSLGSRSATSATIVTTRVLITPKLSSRTRSPGFGERVRDLLFGWRKTLRKVLPRRIVPLNQPDFLFSPPPLDLFFARDRVTNVSKLFAMNKPKDIVSRGKSRDEPLPVFNHPPLQVVGHAGIQIPRPAGKNVNPIRAAHFAIPESNSRSLTRSPTPGDRVRDDSQRVLCQTVGSAVSVLPFRLPRMIQQQCPSHH
jgi:hypothetical protein